MNTNTMVIIDDLELEESKKIVTFLTEAIENGDLDLAIQDCMSIATELDFHKFIENPDEIMLYNEYGIDPTIDATPMCDRCNKPEKDSIHQLERIEN